MKPQLFNESTLAAWVEVDNANWRTLVDQIGRIFFQVGAAQMKELVGFWNNGDLTGVRNSAHSLKSACGTIGGEEAQYLLHDIERAADAGDREKVQRLVAEVQSVFSRTEKRLDEYLKSIQAT